jgi:hypothetical protein
LQKSVSPSLSSVTIADREKAVIVAGAYQRAGISCFVDSASLRAGESWEAALWRQIEKAVRMSVS